MAICTLKGHISRAMDFYNKENVYVCIGKSSPWTESQVSSYDSTRDYDLNPPAPLNTDEMLEVIGYKRIDQRFMVVQDDENGTLEYRGYKWRIVNIAAGENPMEAAVREGARWVYLTADLTYAELPTNLPYRQLGVYTGLTRKPGVDNKTALLPSEVEDPGILEVIDNRKPVYRDNDVKEKIKLVLEF